MHFVGFRTTGLALLSTNLVTCPIAAAQDAFLRAEWCSHGAHGPQIAQSRVLKEILAKYPLSWGAQNYRREDEAVTLRELADGIGDPDHCTKSGECSKSDKDGMANIRGTLRDLLRRLKSGSTGFSLVSHRHTTEAARISDLVHVDSKFALVCATGPTQPPPPPAPDAASASPIAWKKVRIRGKSEDLRLPLEKVDDNSISYANVTTKMDYVADASTYGIDSSLGYAFSLNPRGAELVPFVALERKGGSNVDPKKEVNNLKAGMLLHGYFDVADDWFGSAGVYDVAVTGRVEYVTDDSLEKQIAYGQLIVDPFANVDGFAAPYYWGTTWFATQAKVELRADALVFLDDTRTPEIINLKEHQRIGAFLGGYVTLLSGAFRPILSLGAEYRVMEDFSSDSQDLNRFEALATLSLADEGESGIFQYGITLKYTDGNADVTLQDVRTLELGFSFRH